MSTIRIKDIRWVLLLIIPMGYLLTHSHFENFAFEYISMNVFAFFACCLLTTRLGSSFRLEIPIWIILFFLIVGYYIKFYLLILQPPILRNDNGAGYLIAMINSQELALDTFSAISIGFISFCLTAWILLVTLRPTENNRARLKFNDVVMVQSLEKLIVALMIITGVIMFKYNIGIAGLEAPDLPFRIAGWIYHSRALLIPALILLVIWRSYESGLLRHAHIGIMLLFIHGLSDMVLKSSKGMLLIEFMMLFSLLVIIKKVSKRHIQLIVIVILIVILLFPLISLYRNLRIGLTDSIGELMDKSLVNLAESYSLSGYIEYATYKFIYRFVGAEALFYILDVNYEPFYSKIFSYPYTMARFFTVNVMGTPEYRVMGISPGLLGWMYLVGGKGLIVIGTSLFTVITWILWMVISKLNLHTVPILKAMSLFLLASACSEGVFSNIPLQILITIGSVLGCELYMLSFKSVKHNIVNSGSTTCT